jgi:hypothetical protein
MSQTDRDSTTTSATSPPAKFVWRGAWVTATVYNEYDVFRFDGASYITLETHTSGTFSTDLAAEKVELFADKGLSGSGSGDMLGSANLSEIADDAAARTNIGAAKSGANTDITSLDAFTANGDITMASASIITAEGATVTAAATTNIWATDGDTKHVSGNTTITSFGTAPQAGARVKLIFDGTPILTQSADLNLNAGGDNITIEAGDWAEVYADTTTQFDVVVHRKSGAPVTTSLGGISLLKYTVITATNATWAKQAGTTAIEVLCVGGGGAGDSTGATGNSGGEGGQAGCQVRGYLDTGLTSTFVATVGAASAGNGNTTSFTTSTPTTIASAAGGLAGSSEFTSSVNEGQNGQSSVGRGGAGGSNTDGSAAAANSGAGGGGAGGATNTGGNGGSGIIYVWEYG